MQSPALPSALADRPDVGQLERSLARILAAHGEHVEFVVLFGSMARGDWSIGSDYDLIVGLVGDYGRRLVDRIGAFEALVEGPVQVFPYNRSAWQRMFEQRHLLLLEALEHGVVLHDRGAYADLRARFRALRERGVLAPTPGGWRVDERASG